MSVPTDLLYTPDHEWLRLADGTAVVGVTHYAADALGEVVHVELPAPGTRLVQGQVCGEIESTKSVGDLFAPADGEVLQRNETVVAEPALVNTEPYGTGWLFTMSVPITPDLLDAAGYAAQLDHDG
ncbi:glycine cleavage system protein GcvH [Nakamurella leprariae]|uniref:Glycine cleavage system H protein n=1 Tax=Nakamurella leprariae TaxID=2803911 RepID=A0A939BXI1_9ACTN|nr:glycine cleavage system protein GcvH [Nakamurella leprariae]MBM9468578.1 glycine cleavage system protein GcvH [Nakamurella leprariae]